ncbi:MAG: OB-fold nucleic acid binding domain-containing protein, partial [Pseudomonadota bacterium]
DLVIEVAIVRPGPIQGDMVHPYLRRRDGLEREEYPSPHPQYGDRDELKDILGKTKGVPLFQEQAMRIAMEAARFNASEINELRRALATFRKRGTIHQLEERMVRRMVARGYDPEFAARCFNQIKGFGEYGFPESHAASFAHLVYVSSWLKCHYPAAFCAAILNAQPMGFYAPAQLVRDAREHGVDVLPPDINASDWDATLEPRDARGDQQISQPSLKRHAVLSDIDQPAVRLGLRQIDGLRADEAQALIEARSDGVFSDVNDAWRRSGVRAASLEKLAAADAMRSLGLDRRQALWDVKALGTDVPLPLFSWMGASDHGAEDPTALPPMALGEHVVNDYQTIKLSLKAHPLSFLRDRLARERIVETARLADLSDGTSVGVAGVVLVRQRPGSAKGVVFMTLEDETGVCNTVVWPKMMERYRKVLMTARLIVVRGTIQRHENIIHVVSRKLEDRSDMLFGLSELGEDMRVPLANADEVVRPDPGSARAPDHPRWAGHPRNERVIPKRIDAILPKSRDFH